MYELDDLCIDDDGLLEPKGHNRRNHERWSSSLEGDQPNLNPNPNPHCHSHQHPLPSLGWPLAAKTHKLFGSRLKRPSMPMPLNTNMTRLSNFNPNSNPSMDTKKQNGKELSEIDMMKERFAKLLLGEDMSGGGKGVSSALALSNAITNLAASIFTELSRLEPLSPERKTMWKREIGWFLSVTDHIVEFVPSSQNSQDGSNMEIMVTKPRSDLHMNIPALRKLDTMLLDTLEKFREPEFWYVNKSMEDQENYNQQRQENKWWLPSPKVPMGGLSRNTRKMLQNQRDSVNQILKAAMAINAQVLSEMEIPDVYLETLPKTARASLGDSLYRHVTSDQFTPEALLSSLDLSTEHNILDVMNRVEASIAIWKRKIHKDSKSSWGGNTTEKKELFGEKSESLLLLMKHKFRGLPQTVLDVTKIQYNKDVGQSILESYSRVLESLAFNILARIDDVLYADNQSKRAPSSGSYDRSSSSNSIPNSFEDFWSPSATHSRLQSPAESPRRLKEFEFQVPSAETNTVSSPTMTLSDHIGWQIVSPRDSNSVSKLDDAVTTGNNKSLKKLPVIITNKQRISYIERLEDGVIHSPAARD